MAVPEEIERMILNLQNHFDGNPWYGESLLKKLESIYFKTVNKRSESISNSIAVLVKHIINWRIYVIRKMKNDIHYTVEINGPIDWENIVVDSESEWLDLIKELKQTQIELIELLKTKDATFLKSEVPDKSFDFQFLIEGIIQHDIYHQGQIALAAKL